MVQIALQEAFALEWHFPDQSVVTLHLTAQGLVELCPFFIQLVGLPIAIDVQELGTDRVVVKIVDDRLSLHLMLLYFYL